MHISVISWLHAEYRSINSQMLSFATCLVTSVLNKSNTYVSVMFKKVWIDPTKSHWPIFFVYIGGFPLNPKWAIEWPEKGRIFQHLLSQQLIIIAFDLHVHTIASSYIPFTSPYTILLSHKVYIVLYLHSNFHRHVADLMIYPFRKCMHEKENANMITKVWAMHACIYKHL